jgi:hypothetical protein
MLSANDEIGHCVIGAQASDGPGARHWHQMLANPDHAITAWHRLAPKWDNHR